VNGIAEIEDDVVGKDSVEDFLRTVHVEKNIQVTEPVFEEKPVFEEEEIVQPAKLDLAKETHVEMVSLVPQTGILVQDQGPAKAQEEDNDINDINDLHHVSPTPVLELLSIPPITTNQQEERRVPRPRSPPFANLTLAFTISLSSQKPSAPDSSDGRRHISPSNHLLQY
jgi:hypothetical protein